MSLEVEVLDFDSYLSIKAVGTYSLRGMSNLFDGVKAEAEKRNCHAAVLNVSEVSGTIPIMDMFMLGEHCSKVWKPPLRIAVVPAESWIYKFFENVARNRGVLIAVVPDQAAGNRWLASA